MNISNLFNFQTTNQRANPFAAQTAKQPVTDVSPLALAVQRADQRIQTEVQDNTAQLSSFGQLKSAVSDLQMAAQSLDTLASADTPVSAEELKDALSRLVSTFNAATATVRTAAALPGDMAKRQAHWQGPDGCRGGRRRSCIHPGSAGSHCASRGDDFQPWPDRCSIRGQLGASTDRPG